ncbi:unnamed protein product [Adineta ricciae]|uniref:Potassium channel domain-containing protein n=1 Tax=Adineta ricciae TaxID=249248 RepID=A0A814PGH7_ADIRI|nr:unnamed protein product [Adineta ricciae]
MAKKFDIRDWISSMKCCSLLFIPHLSICLVFLIYMLIGASILQEIESEEFHVNSSSVKHLQKERERLLIKIIEKRQVLDLQQYTRYVYKHLRQYENELKKQALVQDNSTLNFSNSLFFLGTSLTTIGSNEFIPKTNLGKIFVIIFTSFGIPLTLVFLTDLSYLIQELIECISLILFDIYSTKYFLRLRRFGLFHFIEKQCQKIFQSDQDIFEKNLTILQLIITLTVYILFGAWFISSKSFFESIYLCFTIIFTISFNRKIHDGKHLFFTSVYLFIGLAIGFLYVKAVKVRMERLLETCGDRLLKNLMVFTEQLGYHDLNPIDILTDNHISSYRMKKYDQSCSSHIPRAKSAEQQSSLRPVGIAEPFRRLSTGIIGRLKSIEGETESHLDKSVQVTTIIRRCGRCADSTLPILPVRKHSVISTSSSSIADSSSGPEDDEAVNYPPPNLDRIRQRRATLVAKTIINQMATQPQTSSIDDALPSLALLPNSRRRAVNSAPNSVTCSVKVSASPSPELPRKYEVNQEEFSQLSKQIAALLTPSDDEN